MFTGLVEAKGKVVEVIPRRGSTRMGIAGPWSADQHRRGESIAVDGACLTVSEIRSGRFYADVIAETLSCTTLGRLRPGQEVNLERALRLGDSLGGHLVQGHVDGVVRVLEVRSRGGDHRIRLELIDEIRRYVALKGSVALHGVSLTVSGLDERGFEVALIPETLNGTTLSRIRAGDRLNVEVDLLARYLERLTSELRGSRRGGRIADVGPGHGRHGLIMADQHPIESPKFSSVEEVIGDLRQGRMIIVLDDEDRENEGDLVCAAELVTPETINFMATHGRGLICLSMTPERLRELDVPLMVNENTTERRTAFCVSIEARHEVTTGISAADRAKTVRLAVDPGTRPTDLARPGHVFPLMAQSGGVLKRAGHTEASVDFCRLGGLRPAAVICEIMNDDGSMARLKHLGPFSRKHGLKMISIADLIGYRMRTERLVSRVASPDLPTLLGKWKVHAFHYELEDVTHVALVMGDPGPDDSVLVRVHSECLTGDVFGSTRCDCGPQLQKAMDSIAAEGRGAILYLRQEGRGIGLANKLKAYELQDRHHKDTVEANLLLGFDADHRDYGVGAQILYDLGIRRLRLMTNNMGKYVGLKGYGLEIVDRVPLELPAHDDNREYLRTKKIKMGHLLKSV